MERCKNVFEAILKYGHDEDWLPDPKTEFRFHRRPRRLAGEDRDPSQAAGAWPAAVARQRPLRLQRPGRRDPPPRLDVESLAGTKAWSRMPPQANGSDVLASDSPGPGLVPAISFRRRRRTPFARPRLRRRPPWLRPGRLRVGHCLRLGGGGFLGGLLLRPGPSRAPPAARRSDRRASWPQPPSERPNRQWPSFPIRRPSRRLALAATCSAAALAAAASFAEASLKLLRSASACCDGRLGGFDGALRRVGGESSSPQPARRHRLFSLVALSASAFAAGTASAATLAAAANVSTCLAAWAAAQPWPCSAGSSGSRCDVRWPWSAIAAF